MASPIKKKKTVAAAAPDVEGVDESAGESTGRGRDLIIVESPTKAKTIQKYLAGKFNVVATVGHVKDLPKSKLGVEIEKDFEPTYELIPGKNKILGDIRKAAKNSRQVFLAPDPDREGEAIAYHVAEAIKKDRAVGDKVNVQRVLFYEITKRAIEEALKKPTEINVHLFEAHKARRVLDRLVGYQISPVLWDKVRRGLSAGRVQSVAVRMICDREAEIRAFVAEEYWQLTAHFLSKASEPFMAKLLRIGKDKAELKSQADAQKVIDETQRGKFVIDQIERKERKNNPLPPFITSKLQQDAANRFGFTAKKTMVLAQQLYEGIEVGEEGPIGLITYMRTDSVRLSDDSIRDARSFIEKQFGKEHLPAQPNIYKSKKSAQDAHEAIRPTLVDMPPSRVAKYLDKDQLRLYELIWNRYIASQMNPAIMDRTAVDIVSGNYTFRATGSVIKYPGYLLVYEEAQKAKTAEDEDEESGKLPALEEGENVTLEKFDPTQHFTQPPPRYTESSLVKALEENGIGRPSTYASIMSTILDKDYVKKDANKFVPTQLGMLVTDLLVGSFPDILNVEFTANLENELDGVEEGQQNWVGVLKDFYKRFEVDLKKAKLEMRNLKTQEIPTDFVCEKCSKKMVVKWGRNGEFIACSGYPDCRNTKEFKRDENGKIVLQVEESTGEACEKCGKPLIVKRGRFGSFVACSGYPECKNTKALSTGVKCPEPGCDGEIAIRNSRKGKIFYSCTKYPKCKYAIWDKPVGEPCPVCQAPFLVEKTTKKAGTFLRCLKCDYQRAVEAA